MQKGAGGHYESGKQSYPDADGRAEFIQDISCCGGNGQHLGGIGAALHQPACGIEIRITA